jgi:guanylate kinase
MPIQPHPRALLIVVSAPSGAGKTTLCDRLRAEHPEMAYSISCTTREPRGDEQDGADYFFLSEDEFSRRLAAGAFLEHAVVHGHRYGTPRKGVEDALKAGRSVLMDIDVEGARQIRERVARAPDDDLLKRAFVDIFIEPPSMQALKERLEGRAEDAPEVIAARLRNAEAEMDARHRYRYRIVNRDLDKAYAELKAVLEAEQRGRRGASS